MTNRELLKNKLNHLIMKGGLAAKWGPRKGVIALNLRAAWGMSPKTYRKFLVNSTNVVETLMCNKEWEAINFAQVPSVAAARYNKAFFRNAKEQYETYKNALVKGETKINASSVFPHDIVRAAKDYGTQKDVVDAQWKALPNFLGGKASDILVMSDVSGSMSTPVSGSIQAIDVSIALGLYISERQVGPFKDMVLTFSQTPRFHKVMGNGITERINNLNSAQWDMSTNINAAFKLVCDTGIQNNVPAEDMPKMLLILSDMEFDACGGRQTNYQAAQKMFADAGYEMPRIVFWNLNSRTKNVPVRNTQEGTALVSGFSPAVLGSVLNIEEFNPKSIMLKTIMAPRYNFDLKL